MKPPGDADLRVRTRAALLDALEALVDQLDALVVIGAQAGHWVAVGSPGLGRGGFLG